MKAKVSKIVIFLGVIAIQALLAPLAYSYCLVSTQDGRGGNIYGLPYAVDPLYQGSSAELASCSTANGSLDDWLGFEQAIRFATSEAGYLNNVNVITLRNPLVFDNPSVNVVVGNWPYLLPVASTYDYLYPINYDPDETLTRDDYGIITLDTRANFDPEVRGLVCADGTNDVILRNLIIQTDGITRAEFFDQTADESSCFKDGGAVYICPGLIEGDPHANPSAMNTWCDVDGDRYTVVDEGADDCDDNNAAIRPGAIEVCGDGIDNNCDGNQDEGLLETYYRDNDGDGYGAEAVEACSQPEVTVTTAGDCDDIDELINPVAPEACIDGLDNNCDGDTDEDCECDARDVRACGSDIGACVAGTETCAGNGLSWGACIGAVGSSPEICGNGNDEDCSGADLACPPVDPLEVDNDGDLFCEGLDADGDCDGSPGAVDGDCNDLNASIKPGAVEICGDSVDNNCAGGADEGCVCPPGTTRACGVTDVGPCEFGIETCSADGLSWGACAGSIGPSPEVCGDGIDNDCDGADVGDCPDPDNEDNDGDGFTENEGDCNDDNPAINPGATDACGDGVDQDCSGADISCPLVCSNGLPPRTWYLDADGDTYGTSSTSVEACEAPTDYVVPKTDCDDSDSTKNPGADELCEDSEDNDCDGRTNEGCAGQGDEDDDDDGFCESLVSCDDGSDTGDCDDTNPMINPGTEENCGDGTDNNCDGAADINDLQCQVEEPPPDEPPVIGEDGLLICPIDGNPLNLCPLQGGSLFGGCSLNAGGGNNHPMALYLILFLITPLFVIRLSNRTSRDSQGQF